MPSRLQIGAIVLAAGLSRRAGPENKLLHPVDGKTMIRRSVEVLVKSDVDPIVVVTGYERKKIEAELSDLHVSFIHNKNFADGMGPSIGCGVAALPEHVDGALICLGDMPSIPVETISALINAAQEGNICVPVYDGRRGNPVLFTKQFFQALMELRGDKGGKMLLQENDCLVCEVVTKDPGVMIDYDDFRKGP